MNSEKRTLIGLAILVGALAVLVVGYWVIWEAEYCWRHPLFAISSSFSEAGEMFDQHEKERAKIIEAFAELRKRNATDFVKAGTSKNRDELFAIWAGRSLVPDLPGVREMPIEDMRLLALATLNKESANNLELMEAEHRVLVRAHRKTLEEKANDELQRQHRRQGWAPSIGSSVLVLLLASVIAFLGLRFLRQSALPGTVFDNTPEK